MKRLFWFLLTTTGFLATSLALHQPSAAALSGSDFQAGRIMDDGVFFNAGTIDPGSIQTFLNSKVPTCDTNGTQPYNGTTRAAYGTSRGYPPPYTCLKNYLQDTPNKSAESGLCNQYIGGTRSAAQIIYDVGQACGINPKVLIVLLEKEQSLVTDDWPWSIQYRSATGYGCPDTAPCDAEYYGFFNQVYNAARQFKRYARDESLFRYRAHRDNYIQYNPNAACGGSNVFIHNQATAGLYNYTPYQPNASALANIYGSGDGCGAYGNRNFWRLYNDWFGYTFGSISLTDSPASVSWGSGRIDVIGRGSDMALWQRTFDASTGGWKPWSRIGGSNVSSPGIASMAPGRLDAFIKGPGGDLQHTWYTNNMWQQWESLGQPPGTTVASAPSAISWENGRLDIFVRGNDSALWQKWYDASTGGWKPWVRLGGNIGSAPSVSSWGKGRLDIFARGHGGDLYHTWFGATGWGFWESLGEPSRSASVQSAPGAISWNVGRIDIFVRGTDGVLWQKWFDAPTGGWKPWVRFGGVINSAPTVSSWEEGRLDIFSTGPASDLQHYWFAGGSWRSWESLGKPAD